MTNKNLLTLFLLTVILVMTLMTFTSALQWSSMHNISIVLPKSNGSLYATTNATTTVINFTIQNGTGINIANFTYFLDGVGVLFCSYNGSYVNSSGNLMTAKGVNVSSCLGDNVVNSIYLNLSEGRHTLWINATIEGLNTSSKNIAGTNVSGTNVSFYINNFQSLAFVSTVRRNGDNLSATSIMVNVTLNSIMLNNINFTLWNYTMGVGLYNRTNFSTPNHFGSANITWSGLPNKDYTYNVSIWDNATGYNYTLGRTIRLDTIAPNTSSISCSGWKSSDEGTVEKDSTLTCTCSTVDNNATWPVVYQYSPSSTPPVSETGLFGVNCWANDVASNNGTSSAILTYTVIEVVSSEGTGGTGGTGGSSGTGITGTTYTVSTQQFSSSSGYTGTLSANDGVKVSFKSSAATSTEQHIIKVSEVTTGSATIIISSTPITLRLNIGEEKKVDIDSDGTYDVYVKLNTITNGKADFTVKQTTEAVPAGEQGPVSGGTGIEPEPSSSEPKSNAWMWILIVVVILIAIGAGVTLTRKKKK